MKRFLSIALLSLLTSLASAESELMLNGLASFEQLRHEYYLGALYLPQPAQSADDALYMPGPKRMDMRIVTESWSPRRFGRQWNQLISINNPAEQQQKLADDIIAFTNMLSDDLLGGDQLVVEQLPKKGTRVLVNGNELFSSRHEEFFNLLLNCWIGQRPPSTGFKQNILSLPGGEAGNSLLAMFEATAPTETRRRATANWSASASVAASAPAEAEVKKPDAADAAKKAAAEKARKEKEAAEKEKQLALKAEQERLRQEAIARAVREAEIKARAEAERKQLIADYSTQMVRSSYKHVRYPKRALKLNQEGTVLLEVVLKRSGDILSVKILQSAGYPALDDAAVKAVEKTAPFDALPKGIPGDSAEFTLPFTFQISS